MSSFFRNLLPVVAGLSSVRRYSMVTMSRDESVLEHLGMVALTCLLICNKLGLDKRETSWVLSKALLHDVEEVVIGDVARPTKHYSAESKRLFENMAHDAVNRLEKMLDVDICVMVSAAKVGKSGSIVALADMLAVVYKVWDEVLVRGNVTMVRQASKVRDQLESFLPELLSKDWNEDQRIFLREVLEEAILISEQAVAMNRPTNFHIEEVFVNEH